VPRSPLTHRTDSWYGMDRLPAAPNSQMTPRLGAQQLPQGALQLCNSGLRLDSGACLFGRLIQLLLTAPLFVAQVLNSLGELRQHLAPGRVRTPARVSGPPEAVSKQLRTATVPMVGATPLAFRTEASVHRAAQESIATVCTPRRCCRVGNRWQRSPAPESRSETTTATTNPAAARARRRRRMT
jgi:hypothetical protein